MVNTSVGLRSDRVDVSADSPLLSAYTFLRSTGTDTTLTGYFVDIYGNQVSALQTYTISNAAAGYTFTSLYNAANSITALTPLPANFAGFFGVIAANTALYVGLGGRADGTIPNGTTITTEDGATADYRPAATYPQCPTGNRIRFGRVSDLLFWPI